MRHLASGLALIALLASPASAQIINSLAPAGAPTGATYITQTTNATLTAEQALNSLTADRLLRNTTGGVLANSLLSDDGTNVTVASGQLLTPNGSAAAPSHSFTGNLGIGMGRSGASTLNLVANTFEFLTDTNDYASFEIIAPTSSTWLDGVKIQPSVAFNATSGTQMGLFLIGGTFSPGSGTPTDVPIRLRSTINWGGTPGAGVYELLRIEAVETAIPTGSNYIMRMLAGAAGTTFRGGIRNTGQWESGGTAPTLSSCGTTPSIATGGNDVSGKVTVGTGVTTSCTVTFANTWANAPPCTVSGDNTAVTYIATSSTTVLTLTSSADMASDVLSYICHGNNT